MDNMNFPEPEGVLYTCRLCKWRLNPQCDNLFEHECFVDFDENRDQMVVDENFDVYLVPQSQEQESAMQSQEQESAIQSPEPQSELGKLRWTHEAILFLISSYKHHRQEFQSTKEKNTKVWGRLALELQAEGFSYTSEQCQFKFKYLKSKYMRKKDNARTTGEAPITFKYFDQMDEIFGKKPNVQPPNLASNLVKRKVLVERPSTSASTSNVLEDDEMTEPEAEPPSPLQQRATPKTKKSVSKSNLGQLIDDMKENSRIREENQQKRHQENMEFRQRLLDSFNSKMDALIDTLNKN